MIRVHHDAQGAELGWEIRAGDSSYVIALFKGRYLAHYHWGQSMEAGPEGLGGLRAEAEGFGCAESLEDRSFSLHRLPQEYPWAKGGDFRSPALAAEFGPGAEPVLDLFYAGYRILPGLPAWGGLPLPPSPAPGTAPAEDSEALELELADEVSGLRVFLLYAAFPESGVILRCARLENRGLIPIRINRAMSFSLDLPPCVGGLDLLATRGGWARERQLEARPLGPGRHELSSRKGVSGHASSPAILLARPGTCEAWGEAWMASLLYSGDWTLAVESSEDGGWRLQGGLNPELTTPLLEAGAVFHTPAVALAHGTGGLGELARRLDGFARERLLDPAWASADRPVVLNSWEALYFAYDETDLLDLAATAKDLGAEVLVVDDGWFGHRDDATSSLGDWWADPRKFPSGLGAFADKVHGLGLGLGLWMEPEAISRDSLLYTAHPDWALALEGREATEGRSQLLLDLSRRDVRDYLLDRITSLVREARLDYLKWDMNRPFSKVGRMGSQGSQDSHSCQGSLGYKGCHGSLRYEGVLGLYALLGEVKRACPGLLIEACSGGGGRVDWGLLAYLPQFWLSDNTDPTWRAPMQDAARFVLPQACLAAHVSASPNHQTGRVTSPWARAVVAMAGVLGLELDPRRLSPEETTAVRKALDFYKAHRGLLQRGQTYLPAAEAGDWARLVAARDGSEAVLLWMSCPTRPNRGPVRLRLEGLVADARYVIHPINTELPACAALSGSELMARGLEFACPQGGEPQALALHLKAQPKGEAKP